MTKQVPPEVLEQIESYAAKGKSGSWVAAKLGIPPATVNYRMLRAGFDPWPDWKTSVHRPANGFTDAEDEQLLELGKTMGVNRIADIMKRPRTSVRIRLMTLEIRAEKALEGV